MQDKTSLFIKLVDCSNVDILVEILRKGTRVCRGVSQQVFVTEANVLEHLSETAMLHSTSPTPDSPPHRHWDLGLIINHTLSLPHNWIWGQWRNRHV